MQDDFKVSKIHLWLQRWYKKWINSFEASGRTVSDTERKMRDLQGKPRRKKSGRCRPPWSSRRENHQERRTSATTFNHQYWKLNQWPWAHAKHHRHNQEAEPPYQTYGFKLFHWDDGLLFCRPVLKELPYDVLYLYCGFRTRALCIDHLFHKWLNGLGPFLCMWVSRILSFMY